MREFEWTAQAYRITKRFDFSASHVLAGLPDGHPCGRLHGHNYAVEIELRGALDDIGFVLDYGELAAFRSVIDDELDHRHLNDLSTLGNPTAETLARWLWERALDALEHLDEFGERWGVAAVRVSETPKTWAEYRP